MLFTLSRRQKKKVAASLTKKKLEVFVPMVYTKTKTFRKNKFVFEPLFRSIVFVQASQEETQIMKQTNGVINLLYWLGKPAVIDTAEINAIREFTENYSNIRIEPTSVNNEEEVNNFNGSSISIEGKLYAVKNKPYGLNCLRSGITLPPSWKKKVSL